MARVRVLETARRSPGRHETDAALTLAQRLPRLVLEARRVAATLSHGIHGRRRAGVGETFWQFRPFVTGEAAQRVDWRRSARDDRLYVREREWEAAQNVWLWIDRSASMGYVSSLAQAPKIERALVLGMALADTFVNAGERVGLLGLMRAARLAPDRREDRRGDRRRPLRPRRRPAAAGADRTLRRGGAHQRLPLAGRRDRGGRRGHRRARRPRPSRDDRRPGRGDLPLLRPGGAARARGRHRAARRRRRLLGRGLPRPHPAASRRARGPRAPARLDPHHPPHRPAGDARRRCASSPS